MKNNAKYIIGIDEAGRGPLAGPVSVGVVLVPADFDWDLIPGVGDSKQVSERNRGIIFKRAQELQKSGQLHYKVVMVSAKIIDKKGIVFAINSAMKTALNSVMHKSYESKQKPRIPKNSYFEGGLASLKIRLDEVMVRLDGSLRAPDYCVHQETIIKGDSKEKVIGLASILAKVTRDRYMVMQSLKPEFAIYDFARHKGYGTKVHREAIAKNGLSPLHRVSYCRNIRVVV
jgi:ribonuclease HII